MITYRVTQKDLVEAIIKHNAAWFGEAKAATAACIAVGKYVDEIPANPATGQKAKSTDGLWGKIKEVFMTFQHSKCCYCERVLESQVFGKIEHDVEHYRPKSRVRDWFSKAVKKDLADWPASLTRSGAEDAGYYLLAFDPRNYATACKTCNSTLKSDYFPCRHANALDADSPAKANADQPWLIFPFGDLDELAEDLIDFEGIVAQPAKEAAEDELGHWRARVTIRFFRLNMAEPDADIGPETEGRENLLRERARELTDLARTLDSLETTTSATRRKLDEDRIKFLISAESPHASCKRSFKRLWENPATREKAVKIWVHTELYFTGQTIQPLPK